MANCYFKYGTMNAGKSIDLLKVNHNYIEQGKKTLLFTPAVDDRYGVGKITSRIGVEEEAIISDETFDFFTYIKRYSVLEDIYCVLIDEAQFLRKEQIIQLTKVVDDLDIPVMCFGLKNDFQNNLFEGSEAMLLYFDKSEEIKTICSKEDCGKKAIMNLRLADGRPIYEGEQVEIGGNEAYLPLCRKHYFNYD